MHSQKATIKPKRTADGNWRVDTGRALPKRYRQEFATKGAAESFIEALFDRAAAPPKEILADQINKYMEWSELIAGKTKETCRVQGSRLRRFGAWAESQKVRSVCDITSDHIAQFQEYFFKNSQGRVKHRNRYAGMGRDPKESRKKTWMLYRGALSAFFNWSIDHKMMTENPAALKRFIVKPAKNIPRRFTPDQILQIFDYFDRRDKKQEPPYFPIIFRVLAYTGIRPGKELWNIQWSHINLKRRTLQIPQTKTKRPRILPINKKLITWLKRLPKEGRYIFTGNRGGELYSGSWLLRQLHEATDNLKLDRRRLYDLRHSFGANLAEKGVPLPKIQKLMGHERIETTMNYINFYDADLAGTTDELDY